MAKISLYFTKTYGHILAPADQQTADYIEALPQGEMIEVKTAGKVRNPRFHARYFAMLNYAYRILKEGPQFQDFDSFRKSVQVTAGYYDEIPIMSKGEEIAKARIPQSISFDSMDEVQFKELNDRVFMVLAENYISKDEEMDFITQFG